MRFLNKTVSFLAVITFALFLTSCAEENPYAVDYSGAPDPFDISGTTKVETESGLVYYEVKEGIGNEEVQRRDRIYLYYTGRTSDGRVFDSSYRNSSISPVMFSNLGSLIQGFREGLLGMKEGEKRVLIIPPELGYGGVSGHQLEKDTLRFDIELDEIIY